MRDELWKRARNVLTDALELRGAARQAFLDEACAFEPDLRAEVERFLVSEEAVGSEFLEPPPSPTSGSGAVS